MLCFETFISVHRNISACKEFAETVQSCYGPNGMNKMVINHLEKLFVTNDAATIIRFVRVLRDYQVLLYYYCSIRFFLRTYDTYN